MPNREAARKSLQAELGIDSSVRFVGQVSVLRRLKGHRTLIEAFDRIASSFPSLHLVLVGAGPVEQDIKKAVLDSPHKKRIHLLGHKEDPWPFFRAFEVSVLASLSDEGIPQSLTRSMYAQTPVVGTDVGGITEVVLNGSTGLTAIPGDSTSLGAVLKSLLEDKALQERLSEKARDLVTERFRWDALGQKIEDLFRG
jgi:glycosyltransferase involved in cell wall biosynthesis